MNLYNLPPLSFAERDSGVILSDLVATYEEQTGRAVDKADPVYSFLATVAYWITVERKVIEENAKRMFLAYMSGDFLDQWGYNMECPRIQAKAAGATLRFTLTEAQSYIVIVPAGTRAQSSSGVTFATDETLNIPAGETYGDVHATCENTGTIGNGFLLGQISYLMDPIMNIETSVSNITISDGGGDVEDDDRYRERLHEAPNAFSVAGSTAAYEYWAKSVSSVISDVKAYTPSPGRVNIVVLTEDGAPSAELLSQIDTTVSADSVRPLTDFVEVEAPETQAYEIRLKYWIDSSQSVQQETIMNSVAEAVQEYIKWQRAKLGRGVDPSELIKLVKLAGAKRVEVYSPQHIPVSEYKYGDVSGEPIVSYGGLE